MCVCVRVCVCVCVCVCTHTYEYMCLFVVYFGVCTCVQYALALGGIKKYQFRYIANIIPRYYGIPSLKVIVRL